MICGDCSAVKYGTDWGIAVSLPCRSWTCSNCAPRRKRQLIRDACDGHPNRFITLTCRPRPDISPVAAARDLAHAWRLIVKRAKRQWHWAKLEYLAVFERTKAGNPHLHILARCGFIPQRWLSAQMDGLTGAPNVDIRRVAYGRGLARYLAKYLGKDPQRFGTLKRYWSTQAWSQAPADDPASNPWGDGRWGFSLDSTWELLRLWESAGLNPWIEQDGTIGYGRGPPGWATSEARTRGGG
jgi:hypothetical protein